MKTRLTLSTFAALCLCLQAEEGKPQAKITPINPLSIDNILDNAWRATSVSREEYERRMVEAPIRTGLNFSGALLPNVMSLNPKDLVADKGDSPWVVGSPMWNIRQQFDTTQPGWRALTKDDFTQVNSADDTWTWRNDGTLACTGKPVSVLRTTKPLTNFELVIEWQHEKPAGNSGVFVWTSPESIEQLTTAGKPGLPAGIEVQILDNAFTAKVAKGGGKTNWFTTHGDVFPVRVKMTPIGKTSPDSSRSFPRQDLCKDHGHWNHYYIRAINGEVRLWVNGHEVSGGTACDPASGYLCLESEGSPIQFRNLHLRELP